MVDLYDDRLNAFICLFCPKDKAGGIADRAGNEPDVYHTHFGVAGLSLLGYPGLVAVDPVYCMPRHVIQRIGLTDKH